MKKKAVIIAVVVIALLAVFGVAEKKHQTSLNQVPPTLTLTVKQTNKYVGEQLFYSRYVAVSVDSRGRVLKYKNNKINMRKTGVKVLRYHIKDNKHHKVTKYITVNIIDFKELPDNVNQDGTLKQGSDLTDYFQSRYFRIYDTDKAYDEALAFAHQYPDYRIEAEFNDKQDRIKAYTVYLRNGTVVNKEK